MKSIRLFIGLLLIFSTIFVACVEDDSQYQFTLAEEFPISVHIGMYPEYSLWKDVMTKSGLYESFNVAGEIKYTMLVPDNESLGELFGIKPFSEWTKDECHELVYNHAFSEEILKGSIREGALDERTINGKLISSQLRSDENAVQVVVLNQSVELRGFPYEATNGLVYAVKGVLTNVNDDLGAMLEKRGDCSFFLEAMEKTGIKAQVAERETTLWNDEVIPLAWTVFAVSDSIYKLSDINTYEELKTHYTRHNSAEIKDELTHPNNGLFQHISQHILDEEVFANSLMTFPTHWGVGSGEQGNWYPSVNHYACLGNAKCLQAGELNGVLIINPNEDLTDYTEIIRDKSNLIASNGCLHYVNRVVDGIESSSAYTEMIQSVFCDVRLTDSIEDYGTGAWYNYENRPIKHGVIAEWKWFSQPEEVGLFYSTSDYYYGGSNLVSFNLGGVNTGWVEFQSDPIPAGEYKVAGTIYNPEGGAGVFNFYIDDELMGQLGRWTHLGAGSYGMDPYGGITVFIKRGGRHSLRFEYVSGAGNLRIGHLNFTPLPK